MHHINQDCKQTIAAMAGKVMWCDPAYNKGSATSDPRAYKEAYEAAAKSYLPWTMTRYNGCFIDEAHISRTIGRAFFGFFAMMLASHMRVLATATPLQHTPTVSQMPLS